MSVCDLGPVGISCAVLITGADGSIFRVPCSQLHAVWTSTTCDESGAEHHVCGFQCLRCRQVFPAKMGINPDCRRMYTFEEVLAVLQPPYHVYRTPAIFRPYPTSPASSIWTPRSGHYCQALYLARSGDHCVAHCSACGRVHALQEKYQPVLQALPGPLVPVASILYALCNVEALVPMVPMVQCVHKRQPSSASIPSPSSTMQPPRPPTKHRVCWPKRSRSKKPFWDHEIVRQPPLPKKHGPATSPTKPMKPLDMPKSAASSFNCDQTCHIASTPSPQKVPKILELLRTKSIPKSTPKSTPKATTKAIPKSIPKPISKSIPKSIPKKLKPDQDGWTHVASRRKSTISATTHPSIKKPAARAISVVMPPPSRDAIKTATATARKKKKKKKKRSGSKKSAVDAMNASEFDAVLDAFCITANHFDQDETRMEMAKCVHRVKLLRKVFGALKGVVVKFKPAKQPLYLPTLDLEIVAEMMTHSYHRVHSESFKKIGEHCQRHRVQTVAAMSTDNVETPSMLLRDLPVATPSAQGVQIQPLGHTEWFSPATYIWTYFSVFWHQKLQCYHGGSGLGRQYMFPRDTCTDAMVRVKKVQIHPSKFEGASQVEVLFHTYGLAHLTKGMGFLFPTKVIKVLLEHGYTRRQTVGFILLHLQRLFGVMISTKSLHVAADFDLYAYTPIGLDFASSMALLMVVPPTGLHNVLTPDKTEFTADNAIIMPESWIWSACQFMNRSFVDRCSKFVGVHRSVRVQAHSVCRRHMGVSFETTLRVAFCWGMPGLARASRHLSYLSYLVHHTLRSICQHGRGQAKKSTEKTRTFIFLVKRAVDAAVSQIKLERAHVPLALDNASDVSVPALDVDELVGRSQKYMHRHIMTLHRHAEDGITRTSEEHQLELRNALMAILCRGGAAGLELVRFWVEADGDRSVAHLPHLMWLARYYDAYGSDTVDVAVNRFYVQSPDPVDALGEFSCRHYRKQYAFQTVFKGMECIRDVHAGFTGTRRSKKAATHSGLSISLRDMDQTTDEYLAQLTDIVPPGMDAKSVSVTKEWIARDGLSTSLQSVPSTILFLVYMRRYILGAPLTNKLSAFYLLAIFEEVVTLSTDHELWVLRTALFGFFTKLILYTHGRWLASGSNARLKEVLHKVTGVANFWVEVLRNYTGSDTENSPDFSDAEPYLVLYKPELETVHETMFT